MAAVAPRSPGWLADHCSAPLAASSGALQWSASQPGDGGVDAAAAGQRGWVHRTGGLAVPVLAYGDGRIYASVGYDSTRVIALAASSGALQWSASQPGVVD